MMPPSPEHFAMFDEAPSIVDPALNSNSFVQSIFNELSNSLNVNLETFTSIFTTYYTYYTLHEELNEPIIASDYPGNSFHLFRACPVLSCPVARSYNILFFRDWRMVLAAQKLLYECL